MLFIGRESEPFSELEVEILEVLAEHISLAIEKICLYYEWQDLLLVEERNRLARDLHDSVNQKLSLFHCLPKACVRRPYMRIRIRRRPYTILDSSPRKRSLKCAR